MRCNTVGGFDIRLSPNGKRCCHVRILSPQPLGKGPDRRVEGRRAEHPGDCPGARPGGLDDQPRAQAQCAGVRRLPAAARRWKLPAAAPATCAPGVRPGAGSPCDGSSDRGLDAGADRRAARARRRDGPAGAQHGNNPFLDLPRRPEGPEALALPAARQTAPRPAQGPALARQDQGQGSCFSAI